MSTVLRCAVLLVLAIGVIALVTGCAAAPEANPIAHHVGLPIEAAILPSSICGDRCPAALSSGNEKIHLGRGR